MSLVSSLMEMRNMIDLILESSGSSSSGKVSLKLTKSGKPRKVSDRKGKPTANGDFIKKIRAEHAEELKAFQEASEKKQGAHLTFVSNYKKAHAEEYNSFVAAWKESHSDAGSMSDSASTVDTEEAAPSSASQSAANGAANGAATVQAKKPVKKAQKAITTPVAVPIVTAVPEELLPFTMGKITYLRNGYPRADGNHLWTSGYLWESNKGAKGAYKGQLQADGKIDTDVKEPSA